MDILIVLLLLAAVVTSNGQQIFDCDYLDPSKQINPQSGNGGPFTINVSPNSYTRSNTGGSQVKVTFIASEPYSLLFMQATETGGFNSDAVGSWFAESTAYPITCGPNNRNSIIDKARNQAGVRRFTWTAPLSTVTGGVEFRATIVDQQTTPITWFGLTSERITYTDPCQNSPCQNGGICDVNVETFEFICICNNGFTGDTCGVRYIPPSSLCSPNPCYFGGACVLNSHDPRGFVCSCPPSYSGDLCQTFISISPCSPNPCVNTGTCRIDTGPSGFVCLCPPAYRGNICQTATSPCNPSPCLNGGDCFTNAADFSFICQCQEPWTGQRCDQISCDLNPCGEGECILQPEVNSFVCICNGLTGALGETCPETLRPACEPSPCVNGGTCYLRGMPQTGAMNYLCVCIDGFTGTNCEQDITGTITTAPPMSSAPTTNPSPITSIPTTQPTITPSSPPTSCESMPCMNGGTCLFGDDNYLCICPDTHQGRQCETTVVATTSPPITPANLCNPNPCMNGGTCNSLAGTVFICTCPDTHIGARCQTQVSIPSSPEPTSLTTSTTTTITTTPDPCTNNPCMNEGVCTSLMDDQYMCTCPDTHTGDVCQTPVSTTSTTSMPTTPVISTTPTTMMTTATMTTATAADICASSPCENDGRCMQSGNAYTCECQEGYVGRLCEEDRDECASVPCQNGAECVDEVNGYLCRCIDDYDGVNCEIQPQNCDDYCMNGGVCNILAITNSPICDCVNGFVGTRCHFAPCRDGYCVNGGTCSVVEVGTSTNEFEYQCDCIQGYTGATCNMGVTCADTPCINGATCIDSLSSSNPICQCEAGYNGEFCEIDIDECSSNPCGNQGTCIQTMINSYECRCIKGYTGTNCETQVISVDYCSISKCSSTNTDKCINSVLREKRLCVCSRGFKGNACDEEVQIVAASTSLYDGWLLDPWWVALIGVILLLLVIFIIVVVCFHGTGDRDDGIHPDKRNLLLELQ